jgi:hypothetical protein
MTSSFVDGVLRSLKRTKTQELLVRSAILICVYLLAFGVRLVRRGFGHGLSGPLVVLRRSGRAPGRPAGPLGNDLGIAVLAGAAPAMPTLPARQEGIARKRGWGGA